MPPRDLILAGDSTFAEIAYEYFTYDSDYRVVAFTVERQYLKRDEMCGLPVVALEEVEQRFAPDAHSFYASIVYSQQNQLRTRLYRAMKAKGFAPASYISSKAFVWRNATIGEHCFIFENNVVQPFASVGDNVVLWSGNHIGHHSRIGSNCFLSSHVVISGYVDVGEFCFFGVNASVGNNQTVGKKCTIGAGAIVLGDVPDYKVVTGLWKKQRPTAQ
ncbi:MAG: acetyltransferase [Acidobacteriota bacterium]|nr:acetyltransferase [Acidobacteriota bacterium]